MKHNLLLAHGTLLFVAFIWGSTFVVVQNAISFLEPFSFNAIRFFIAAVLLGGWLFAFERRQLRNINKSAILAGIAIGFWLFIGYAFQTAGLLYTTSSKAGFITGLSVVLVPLFSFLLLKIKLGKNAVIGVAFAAFGLYLLTMTDTIALNLGDGLVFICAIGFALHIITTGKYSKKYPVLLITVIQIVTVSFLSAIFAFWTEDTSAILQQNVLLQNDVLFALLITSIFATAFAFFAQTTFQQYIPPTRVALIFATEPVFAAITGYLWAGDRLAMTAIFGCLLIFAGMIYAEWPEKKKKETLSANT